MRRSKAGGAKKRPTRYTAPTVTPDELALALRAHRKGRWGEAVDLYRARLSSAPDCLDACMNLAALCVLSGHGRQASVLYGRASALAPTDARVQRDVAIGLASIGDLAAAKHAFERAIALEPTMVGALLGICRVCAELGEPTSAIGYAERAVEVAPADASARLELHRARFDDRDLHPCIEAAMQAVRLDPSHALARLFLAGALALADRRAEAEDALGPPGLVAPELRDALDYALSLRPEGPRYFATKRATLESAIDHCTLAGPALEFGVRHGVSTRVIARRLDAQVHAFDSFTGLPEAWQGRGVGAFSTEGELPDVPANVTLHVGLFEATLPDFVARLETPPRLVHVDSDLYSSARTVLHALAPRIVPGCVLVFDELIGNASWRQDEFRALSEASQAFGWSYRPLALSWITGQGVIQIGSA